MNRRVNRSAGRMQVFTLDGKYVKPIAVMGAAGIARSPDRDNRFLYVVNTGGSKIVVIDRQSLEVLSFGNRSTMGICFALSLARCVRGAPMNHLEEAE